jgi:hypothetical protein
MPCDDLPRTTDMKYVLLIVVRSLVCMILGAILSYHFVHRLDMVLVFITFYDR